MKSMATPAPGDTLCAVALARQRVFGRSSLSVEAPHVVRAAIMSAARSGNEKRG
jgi:hypothetical protein